MRTLAYYLRRLADRLDHRGAPKAVGLAFRFVDGVGMVVHTASAGGCRLWYLGDEDYEKAHTPLPPDTKYEVVPH